MLHEYLQDLSKHELEEVARTANIDLSRSKTKKQIVLRRAGRAPKPSRLGTQKLVAKKSFKITGEAPRATRH